MKNKILISLIFSLSNVALATAQTLVPTVQTPNSSGTTKIALVENLPRAEWPVIIAGIVQIILGVVGSLTLIAFTVGGVMFVASQGNEEQISKAKKIIFWSIFALLIIAASYALVLGVSQLQFF